MVEFDVGSGSNKKLKVFFEVCVVVSYQFFRCFELDKAMKKNLTLKCIPLFGKFLKFLELKINHINRQ